MLEELLNKHGSQSAVARAIGVTPMAVSKWYTGKTFPSRKTSRKIAEDLGVSLGDVFDSGWDKRKGGKSDNSAKDMASPV